MLREKKIRQARDSFWEYCKIMNPDFYKETRWHLKYMANTFQTLYEGRLFKQDGSPYTKMILSIPPRHGKSYLMQLFISWSLGKNPLKQKIISASYSKALSLIASRNIRNTINGEKKNPLEITYEDIFPATIISKDNAAVEQWSVEGSFFSYKATSVGASVTGMGTNLAIIDDLVSDSMVANNERELDKLYSWFTDTFLSRMEAGSIMIVIGTMWSSKDHIGRILASEEAKDYYVIKMPAYDKEKDEMICEELLSKEQFDYLKRNIDESIFMANYMATTIDQKNRLYQEIRTYEELPQFEKIISYVDSADEGSDYLCSIVAGIHNGEGYILDVLYTQEPFEVTEDKTADQFNDFKVNLAKIESNSGGRQFARNVQRLLWEKHKTRKTVIQPFHQSKNKVARILTNSTFVQHHLYFPLNWKAKYPEFYEHITTFQRDPKANKHDDGADAITGLAEVISSNQFNPQARRTTISKNQLGL